MDQPRPENRFRLFGVRWIDVPQSLGCRCRLPYFLLLLMLGVPIQTDAAFQDTSGSDRIRAGQMLLEDGVDGLSIVLADVAAPPLTFDQEAQIRLLHETYDRQRVDLLEDAGDGDPEIIERALAEQLLLAAAKFLNPAQRFALGGFLEAEVNADLPEDESELREYLRDLTNAVSGRDGDFEVDGFSGRQGRMPNRNEILEIRINDNAFTTEQSRQGRGRTQIITRGGTGQFNGDGTFQFADESLDARDPFAKFRPPYQTRDFAVNLSAPVLQNRLTLTGSLRNEFSEDGDTIRALTPSGPVNDGITRPQLQRNYTLRATTQINDNHALTFSFTYGSGYDNNRGVGGFGLPEQGSDREETDYNFQVQETAVLSPTLNNELRFRWNREKETAIPFQNAPRIVVRDAFSTGGSRDRGTESDDSFEFGELLMYTGQNVSIKTGFDGQYSRERSESFDNFNGTFTFSDLATFVAGEPITYSVNQGDPLLEVNQFEAAGFIQSDFRVTPRLTVGMGLRYEAQSNLDDSNNLESAGRIRLPPGRHNRPAGWIRHLPPTSSDLYSGELSPLRRRAAAHADRPESVLPRSVPARRYDREGSFFHPSPVVGYRGALQLAFRNKRGDDTAVRTPVDGSVPLRPWYPPVPYSQPECTYGYHLSDTPLLHSGTGRDHLRAPHARQWGYRPARIDRQVERSSISSCLPATAELPQHSRQLHGAVVLQ